MSIVGEAAVTDDAFLGGRLKLFQMRKGLRASIDAVFLAAAVPVPDGTECHILDAGSGSGVVGLSVLTRCPGAHLTGIDIDPELVVLAQENAARNGLGDRTRFVAGDICRGGETLDHCDIQPNSFDHVVSNPPFFEAGTVRRAPEPRKNRANVMEPNDLDKWVRFLASAARADGVFTMIHKADALGMILKVLENRFGGVRVFPLFPHAGDAASRVLVQARKGARSPMSILPGLVLHEADGSFTSEADAVLRGGAALSF